MAESRVIFSQPVPGKELPIEALELSLEDIRDHVDAWLRAERVAREVRLRPTALGFACTLMESGHAIAVEYGTSSDAAIEHALEKVGAL